MKPQTTTSSHDPNPATRRRGAALESAIFEAAWQVLVEYGYNGFTFEAIAARAGTSRPVLYRRWPQREDLLLATLARNWPPLAIPDSGSLRADALELLRTINHGRARAAVLMRIQLADYFRESGTDFNDLRDRLRPPGETPPFAHIVQRAVARGELPSAARSERLLNLPFDLLRHDMLMRMDKVPDDAIVEIVDELWLPLLDTHQPGTSAMPGIGEEGDQAQ
ncbi:TetR/AcrR family transcriptional regulator [Nocardia sp. NPDC056000]|uniref:TetR/AcrR family transcriptional regulator n=1 Tax=Nocardia sp. NPDC056000 TaxID=3345674 RepID=UPI0035E26FE5